MEIKAPAKLNLYLEVEGAGSDGYHLIRTLFEKVSLCDVISLEFSKKDTTMEVSLPGIPCGEQSLMGRTVSLFREATGIDDHFHIKIEKNIPICAGMGGGSSDAAALLKGLNSITGGYLAEEDLQDIGRTLGADIPFFLTENAFGLGTGRGDIVEPVLTELELTHLIIKPPFGMSTHDIYSRWDSGGFILTKNSAWDRIIASFSEKGTCSRIMDYLHNDLQHIVLREKEDIGKIIAWLKRAGAKNALMTGSGSAVFGIFEESIMDEVAEDAENEFPRKEGWQVFIARTYRE